MKLVGEIYYSVYKVKYKSIIRIVIIRWCYCIVISVYGN